MVVDHGMHERMTKVGIVGATAGNPVGAALNCRFSRNGPDPTDRKLTAR
jgi:hypothetical protein